MINDRRHPSPDGGGEDTITEDMGSGFNLTAHRTEFAPFELSPGAKDLFENEGKSELSNGCSPRGLLTVTRQRLWDTLSDCSKRMGIRERQNCYCL